MLEKKQITKLDSITFDDLMLLLDPFSKSVDTFDLSSVQTITPSAMVQLAAAFFALSLDGKELKLIVDDVNMSTYLARAGFFTTIKSVVKVTAPLNIDEIDYEYLRGSNPGLMEITKIESGAALPDLLDQIVTVLRDKFKYRKYDAFDIATVISEICQNTFDHNSQTCGFIAMQVYGRGSKKFLEIGVSDYGEGLTNTLSRNPVNKNEISSDLDAIHLATKLGISQHDDPTRGTGLYHLLAIVYNHEGMVQIRSGEYKVRYRMDKKQGWSFRVPYMPGVQIALTLGARRAG